jgi:hypothetical protein
MNVQLSRLEIRQLRKMNYSTEQIIAIKQSIWLSAYNEWKAITGKE